MFTKEKLEKWIHELEQVILTLNLEIDTTIIEISDEVINELKKSKDNLLELKHTLEQLHTSITSDNSI